MKASYVVEKVETTQILLKCTTDGKSYEIQIVCKEEGKAELQGLPNHLQAFVFNFTEKDIYESAEDIVNVLITMYDSKGDG